MTVYIDADACPVKAEAEAVATRHGVRMVLVSNGGIRPSQNPLVESVFVSEGPDEADKWIAAACGPGDVVVTADIPLAARCIKAGADVIGPSGKPFTEASIGMALATRDMMEDLRAMGTVQGGPKPFSQKDRSAGLQALDLAIQRLKRAGFQPGS